MKIKIMGLIIFGFFLSGCAAFDDDIKTAVEEGCSLSTECTAAEKVAEEVIKEK